MNPPNELPEEYTQLQREAIERYMAAQAQMGEMQVAEAAFRAQAAKKVSDREDMITESTKRTHEKLERQAANCLRPTAFLRPNVGQVEDFWQATYGDVVGEGPTPELACQDFDHKWLGKDEL